MSTLETWPDSWLTPGEAKASRADALTALRARETPRPYIAPVPTVPRSQRVRRRRVQQLARGAFYVLMGATIVWLAWLAFTLASVLQNHA